MLNPEKLDYFQWQIPTGSRVCLTLLQEDDLMLLHNWKSQVDISYLTSKAIQPISLEERQRRFREKIPSIFAIRRIADDQFLGEISLDLNPKNRSAGIGYFTGADYRQQGYTKEGLSLLLDYLFQVVGLNKVMADTGAFNQASIALLKSLGFQQDGCLRQHQWLDGILHDQLLFSLLAPDWGKFTKRSSELVPNVTHLDKHKDEKDVLNELIQREPIFHHPEFGTTRQDVENMTDAEFWEVGASGRQYSREYVLTKVVKRYENPHYRGIHSVPENTWQTKDFQCRAISGDTYLLTYTLVQEERVTRRATLWQCSKSGWKILYHQGTIVQND